MTADDSAPERETSLVDEPEVREALATADRGSLAAVVSDHPSSPLAWAELADLADSEGNAIASFAYATVAVDLAEEQLAASGWQPGTAVPWSDEPNRAYLRALDAKRRAAAALGLDTQVSRLADELASADAEAPGRIASEYTPTQVITIVSPGLPFAQAEATATTGDPLAEPAARDAAGED